MFDGLSPEVETLLNTAAADLPTAQADAGLLAAMAAAVSDTPLTSPSSTPRRKSVLGKLVTAKAAALAGVLLLSGGVASAATGNLPDPAQDAASSVADVVGLDIPKSGKSDAKVEKEHPENHGKDVSGTARDKSRDGDGNHGSVVCEVASDGKCKPSRDEDKSGKGNSAEHRKDGEKRNENSVKDRTTTSTTSTTAVTEGTDEKGRGQSGASRDKGGRGDRVPSSDD